MFILRFSKLVFLYKNVCQCLKKGKIFLVVFLMLIKNVFLFFKCLLYIVQQIKLERRKKYKSKIDDLFSLNCFLGRDWQKFFDIFIVLERKRMDMVRKDFIEGKVKQQVFVIIIYIFNDFFMLFGEVGFRCVQQVFVILIVRL